MPRTVIGTATIAAMSPAEREDDEDGEADEADDDNVVVESVEVAVGLGFEVVELGILAI